VEEGGEQPSSEKRKGAIDPEDDDLEVLDDDDIVAISKDQNSFGLESNKGNSGCDDDAYEGDGAMSETGEDIRRFAAICYENVRLLVVRNPENKGQDMLAIEATMAYHKGY